MAAAAVEPGVGLKQTTAARKRRRFFLGCDAILADTGRARITR
jgi:hypothetical protein